MNKQRWWGVIALLCLVVIGYVDRVNISVMLANPEFKAYFGLGGDRIQQGSLMTAFLLGYGLSAILLTPVLETLTGYRKGLTLSIACWAVLTAISPLAGSLLFLLFLRTLLGISEGPLFSLKTMYIGDHFAGNERGKPNAVSNLGVSLGLAVGFPLVSTLVHQFGWASSFYILAIINLLLGMALVRLFIHPRQQHVPAPSTTPAMQRIRATLSTAWNTPLLGWIMVIEIATLSYLWGSAAWLPSYLTDEKGFSFRQMGWLASLPFLVSLVSKYLGGVILDRIPPKQAPVLFAVGGLTTALSVLGVMLSHDSGWIVFFLLAANACWGAQGAAIPTLLQYHAKQQAVGSAYGLINGVGNLFSAFVPMLMGLVMSHYGSVSSGFSVLIASQVLTLLTGALLLMRLRHTSQPQPQLAGKTG